MKSTLFDLNSPSMRYVLPSRRYNFGLEKCVALDDVVLIGDSLGIVTDARAVCEQIFCGFVND